MMQRFSIYLSVILLVLTSCVKEVKDSSVLPISGMWVELNEDMSVAKLIEFKDGAYIEYAPRDEVKFYYHDYKVWQASLDDFNSKKYQYAVVGDDLILGNPQTPTAHLTKSISLKDDKLYLQGKEYQFIKELTTAYGSELSTSVDNLENIQYSPSAQEITWEYTVSNNPGGIKLVATCEESWVKNIRVDENKVRLSIEENLTSYKREAVVSLCHPATVDKTIKFAQLFYINLSTVETLAPENVSYTQAILKGAVIDDGNSAIQQYGFYLGSDPNHLQKYIVELNDKATFILEVNHLQDATTYYYKAFAVNEIGETHGELKSFTTQKYYLPTIQTLPATDIAASSAILNGKIIDNGGADIQECGFYYGTSQPPSADGIRKSITNVSDSFSILVNGLTDNTIYYLQAYAKNLKGESLGEVVSFTTLPFYAPSVTTVSATNVEHTSAKLNGKIISDGGTQILESGFYYGKSQSDMEKIPCTYFSNNFSLNITGLEDATCYYFQAYAVNSIGETVGEIMNFTTKQITIPNVSTTSSSNISYTSANISGYINSNGGSEISEYGFYYWVNSSSKFKVVLGSNFIGSYSKVLTGLIQNTTYYYQAYAINSKGIAYGNTSSFTTLYDPYNGHAYVDLGLPSGTKWATMNIGASSPSDVGSTFQWGCTVTGNQGNPMFNYEGCISGTEYDAATALWGGNWKIPTYTQALELFKYCTCQVIRDAGTTYYQLTSSLNNKTIILPAANHWTGNVGTYFSISYQRAYAFYGYGFLSESQAEREKSNQLSIRPVCK